MENIWKELSPEEETQFRKWARHNFNPETDEINPVWHPVVKSECLKMRREFYD